MSIDATRPDHAAIAAAARRLEAGELVAFPTETVYGLGADASNPAAIAKIYAAKGRPADHPLIVHVADGAPLEAWAASVPPVARQLIDAFWPGPLTLILPRAASAPAEVAGGQDSIGLRCPDHPVAQALLQAFRDGRGGIAAPSANRFGRVSPTTAAHVRSEFPAGGAETVHVLDGGQTEVGIESTIVDCSRLEQTGAPVLLRPGAIGPAQIAAVTGLLPRRPDAAAPRASGTLAAHYAPGTPLHLVDAGVLTAAVAGEGPIGLMTHSGLTPPGVAVRAPMPAEPAAYAHALYATLRDLDALGLRMILVERPPADPAWDAVNDRLGRAAAAHRSQADAIDPNQP